MNVTYHNENVLTRHSFTVNHEGISYEVEIFVDERGKFSDDSVMLNDVELEGEGEEGDIRESIISHLAENWETIVK